MYKVIGSKEHSMNTRNLLTNCYCNLFIYYTNILIYSDNFKLKKNEQRVFIKFYYGISNNTITVYIIYKL